MNLQETQRQFREAMGNECNDYPIAPEKFEELSPKVALASYLIQEECAELLKALDLANENKDDLNLYYTLLSEVCAESVDLIYVVLDMANLMGLPVYAMFREIHKANMAKRDETGKVRRRGDGKVLKPEGWQPANKLGVLLEARDYKV